MGWVVDKGILRLREQLDAAYPNRSHASDGTIGDAAHSARDSDHNPESPAPAGNPNYQVDAGDYTHDPAHGADMTVVSEAIRLSQDRRVKYVICNRRIYSGPDGPMPWVWRSYTGTDPHTGHMHVSVRDVTHDQAQDWQITIGDDMPTPEDYAAAVWAHKLPGTAEPATPSSPGHAARSAETVVTDMYKRQLSHHDEVMAAIHDLGGSAAAGGLTDEEFAGALRAAADEVDPPAPTA
jgi:hypothetical protein